jgi:hypothetical protein
MQEVRRKNLEEYREHVWGCTRCNYCQNVHAWELKRSRFYQFLSRRRLLQTGHKFRFKNQLLSIDAKVIDLCAHIFDWAKFRQSKGVVKLHHTLDHNG